MQTEMGYIASDHSIAQKKENKHGLDIGGAGARTTREGEAIFGGTRVLMERRTREACMAGEVEQGRECDGKVENDEAKRAVGKEDRRKSEYERSENGVCSDVQGTLVGRAVT